MAGDTERPAPQSSAAASDTTPDGEHPEGDHPGGERHDGEHRVLRRRHSHRMLGGVAAGIADYFDIDPVLVRIAFVVLAVLGGSGILLYLLGWLLIPAEDSGRAVAQGLLEPRTPRRSLFVLVVGSILGIIAVSDLFSNGPWWPHWSRFGSNWNGGLGFFFTVLAIALVVILLTGGTRRSAASRLRWLSVTFLLTVVAVFVVGAATVLTVEAVSGVPMRGGIGSVQWQPTSQNRVHPDYRLGVGNMVLDLRGVDFKPGTTDVKATVGIGHVLVELPSGPSVSVTAHSGLGDVQVFGSDNGGIGTQRQFQSPGSSSNGPGAHIVLDAEVGVGQVQITR